MPSERSFPLVNRNAAPGMESTARAPAARVGSADRWLLRLLLHGLGDPPLRVSLWDGQGVSTAAGEPLGSLRINDRATLWRLLYRPDLEFGEAYTDGRIEVTGDLVELLEHAYRTPANPFFERLVLRPPRPQRNTLRGSRRNIHQHYDVSNDFYRLWLDAQMVYTCAYYPTPTTSLEDAQIAKMEHVCRKVALRPGERVVEAGCGWGALALHMAREHGVSVRAFNISEAQIAYARAQAQQAGLTGRIEFIHDDYRNVSGHYDAFVSVGMLEHVGVEHYRELGRIIDRCLPAHGRGLIHTLGRNRPMRMNAWMERYIFPGSYTPSLREMMQIFEPYDFSVLDVENLRLHYAKTTAEWLARFERVRERVAAMFDDRFVRAWRLYLAGSTAAFTSGTMQLFQVSFARPRHNGMPWTRAHLYQ